MELGGRTFHQKDLAAVQMLPNSSLSMETADLQEPGCGRERHLSPGRAFANYAVAIREPFGALTNRELDTLTGSFASINSFVDHPQWVAAKLVGI
jgi:hypothetical protein